MSTPSSLVRSTQAEEAALTQAFEGLDHILQSPERERGSMWVKRLQLSLNRLGDILSQHHRTAESPNGPLAPDEIPGATPATIERRSEKLLHALADYIAQTEQLRQRAAANEKSSTLHQAASELLHALRDFKAKERELQADSVTMETGVGD